MKKNLYSNAGMVFTFLISLIYSPAFSQDCSNLEANYSVQESRCIATGSITIQASGGSGNYNYRVEGPTSIAYTSSSTITGLSAGVYTISVKDIVHGCIVQKTNVSVGGSYSDPRFTLAKTDVS